MILALVVGIFDLVPSRTRRFPRVFNRRIPDIPQEDNPKDIPEVTTIVSHRLSLEAYKQLEAKVASPVPSQTTTDVQAGYLLGVQHVLKILRDGFTVGT